MYATGLGAVAPQQKDPDQPVAPFPLVDPAFQFWIDGQPATVVYEGQVGPGVYQVNLTIPREGRDGDLPIEITPRGMVAGDADAIRIKDALFVPVQR